MSRPALTDEGNQMLDKVINIWPPIIRKRKEEKILRIIGYITKARGINAAGRELVIEAAKEVTPKSYDPIFHMWEDMERFTKEFFEPFENLEAYYQLPVRVKRWEKAASQKPQKSPEQMKVIAFCASPRKEGNTDFLVDEALQGAVSTGAKVEKIMLHKISMKFCTGCRRCKDTDFQELCIIKDEMDEALTKILNADAIIIGFPIYTGRECAQLSAFFDRWDSFERGTKIDNKFRLIHRLNSGKRAMVIGTWGYKEIDTYDHVIETVISILNLHGVQTVEALSACGFEGILHGLDEDRKGIISKYPAELRKAFEAGIGLVKE